MPANTTQLDIKLGGDSAGAEAAFDRAADKAKTFAEKVKAYRQAEMQSGNTAAERLFRGNGEKGIEYLFGGGVNVAATAFIARQVGQAADEVTRHMKLLKEGSEGAVEAFMGIAKGIPILGEALKVGDALGKAIRGGLGLSSPEDDLRNATERDKRIAAIADQSRADSARHRLNALDGDAKSEEEVRQKYAALSATNVKREAEQVKAAQDEAEASVRKQWSVTGVNFTPAGDRAREELKARYGSTSDDERERQVSIARAEARKNLDAKARAESRKDAADENRELSRLGLERQRAVIDRERGVSAAQAQTRIEGLKAIGKVDAATSEEAKQAFHEAGYAAAESYLKGIKDHPNDAEQIGKDYADKLLAIQQAAEDKAAGLARIRALSREEENKATEKHIADIKSDGEQARLRASGQTYAAELEALRRHHADELAEIEKHKAELLKKDPANAPQINADAKRLANEANNTFGINVAANAAALAEKRKSTEQLIQRMKLQGLEDDASHGDQAAAIEARRLKITEASREEHERILEAMKGEITIAQQGALLQMDAARVERTKRDLENEDWKKEKWGGFLAHAEDSSHLTGLKQATLQSGSGAWHDQQTAKNTAAGNKIAGDTLIAINQLVDLARNGGNFTIPQF